MSQGCLVFLLPLKHQGLFCFVLFSGCCPFLLGLGGGGGTRKKSENQEVISSVILFTYLPIFPCVYVCARACLLPILLGALLF